jgi:hypothetical protein
VKAPRQKSIPLEVSLSIISRARLPVSLWGLHSQPYSITAYPHHHSPLDSYHRCVYTTAIIMSQPHLHTLTRPLPSQNAQAGPSTSPRLPPSPVLLQPLPPASSLKREGLASSELELDRQQRQIERERQLAEALQEQEWEIQRAAVREDMGTWRHGSDKGKTRESAPTKGFDRPPQAWELYGAIDKHDIEFIMRVRDHAFGLLLQKNAGEFPIVYAARQGEKHRDVVILLIGALSRYSPSSPLPHQRHPTVF